jgi:hypothetical protein
MSVTKLPITDLDRRRASRNPWKLSKGNCFTLRLICKHGGTKRVAYVEDVSERILEYHLFMARKRMGLLGNDIRMYLMWDRWTRNDEGELYVE